MLRLDALDEQIIALLTADARSSFATIGAKVGLSAPAVKRRVDRLRAHRVITGFTVELDPAHGEAYLESFVELFCDGKVTPQRLRAIVAAVPQVVAAYTVTGDADALLHVKAADMAEFERVLERIREQRGIAKTRSTVVLSRL